MQKFKKFKPLYILELIFLTTIASLFFANSLLSPKTKDSFIQFADSTVSKCKTDSGWRRCYGDELGIFNKTHKLEDTLEVLNKTQELDPKTKDCHLLAHKIASEEIAKDPKNWTNLFKYVNQDSCIGGYIHGAMEGRKRFDPNFEINAQTIPELCETINKYTGKTNVDPCAHVIGHILLAEVYGNIEEGTKICNELTGQLQSSCNNGLFMENITRDNLVEHGIAQNIPFDEAHAKEIEQICESYTGTSRTSCWREISHLYALLGRNDPMKIYELCSRSESPNNRDECYIHSFNSIMAQSNFTDEQTKFLCSMFLGNDKKLNYCLKWATYVMVNSSPKYADKAINLCKRVGNNLEERCFNELDKNLARLVDKKEQKAWFGD